MTYWNNPAGGNGWYWLVQDSSPGTQVWQGLTGQFVALANADYVAFLAAGNVATSIDTFVNLCQVIDTYNATIPPAGYLAVSSGVNYQMANTPPMVFNFTPTTTGLSLTLPQMNLPGSLAKGRRLFIINGSGTVTFALKDFSGNPLSNTPTVGAGAAVEVELVDNSSSTGGLISYRSVGIGTFPQGNGNVSMVDGGGPISVWRTSAAFTAPRTWTLPAISDAPQGTYLLVVDSFGTVTSTNTLSVARAGADTINGGTASVVLNRAFDWVLLVRAGASNWHIVGGKSSLSSTDLSDIPIPASSGGTGVTYLPLQGFIGGLTLSTAGGSTTMSIAAGMCCSDDATTMMKLAAFSKTTSAWALGTGNGGLDTGTIAASTWYHFFVIERTDTGVVDALISLSATAPTLPTNYTKQRRIGSGKTDGSSNWTVFIQDGDVFRWSVPVNDILATNPGTSAVTRTLTVPTGVNVYADVVTGGFNTASDDLTIGIYLSDLAVADTAVNATTGGMTVDFAAGTGTVLCMGPAQIRTNTSAQIRSRLQNSNANIGLIIMTVGWTDRRGAR